MPVERHWPVNAAGGHPTKPARFHRKTALGVGAGLPTWDRWLQRALVQLPEALACQGRILGGDHPKDALAQEFLRFRSPN